MKLYAYVLAAFDKTPEELHIHPAAKKFYGLQLDIYINGYIQHCSRGFRPAADFPSCWLLRAGSMGAIIIANRSIQTCTRPVWNQYGWAYGAWTSYRRFGSTACNPGRCDRGCGHSAHPRVIAWPGRKGTTGRAQFKLGELAVEWAQTAEANQQYARALELFQEMGAVPDADRTRAAVGQLAS